MALGLGATANDGGSYPAWLQYAVQEINDPSACPYSPCPFSGGGKWPNYRDPLVISIARDGLNFSRHWVVRTAQLPPTPGGVGGPPSLLNCSWPGHQHGGSGCRPG